MSVQIPAPNASLDVAHDSPTQDGGCVGGQGHTAWARHGMPRIFNPKVTPTRLRGTTTFYRLFYRESWYGRRRIETGPDASMAKPHVSGIIRDRTGPLGVGRSGSSSGS